MLHARLVLSTLLALAGAGSASALTAKDTMAEWSSASGSERDRLLDMIGPGVAKRYADERSALMRCLNETAAAGPHASLMIADVAHACAAIIEDRDSDDEIDT